MPSDKKQHGSWEIRKESVDYSNYSAAFKNISSSPKASTSSSQSTTTNNTNNKK